LQSFFACKRQQHWQKHRGMVRPMLAAASSLGAEHDGYPAIESTGAAAMLCLGF
jgi:hypothetical protein